MANFVSNGHPSLEIKITAAESTNKSSLIVVSNRLPFVLKKKPNGEMMRVAR